MAFDPRRRSAIKLSGVGLAATLSEVGLPAHAQAPERDTARGFDVRRYGAVGDGKTIDSPAINRAIEAASAAGGGTVRLPAGTFLCFSIRLKSHVYLALEPGTVILAADSPRPGETTGYNGGTYDRIDRTRKVGSEGDIG